MSKNKMNCKYFKHKIEDFLADALSAEERELFLMHKDECTKCFQLLIKEEPSQVFSRLSKQKIPLSFWQGFNVSITEGISKKQFAARWFWTFRKRSFQVALAAALMFIFVAIIGIYLAPKLMYLIKHEEAPKISLKMTDQQMQKFEQLRAYFPAIENLENKSARLYKFNLEEGLEVVMIFDESINGEK